MLEFWLLFLLIVVAGVAGCYAGSSHRFQSLSELFNRVAWAVIVTAVVYHLFGGRIPAEFGVRFLIYPAMAYVLGNSFS